LAKKRNGLAAVTYRSCTV